MPVDTSMYQTQPVQPLNPLTMLGTVAQTQNAMNQNKLFQQEFADRAALNQAYASTPLDPATGQPDMNKLIQNIQGSGAARLLPQALESAQKYQSGALANQGAQIDQQTKQRTAVYGSLTSLLQLGDNVTMKDVWTEVAQHAAESPQLFDLKKIVPALSQLPQGGPELKSALQRMAISVAPPDQQARMLYGDPTVINTGGQTRIVSTPTMGGPTQVRGVAQNTPSPDALLPYNNVTKADQAHIAQAGADLIPVPQPDGSTRYFTRGALAGTGGIGQGPQGALPISTGPKPGAIAAADKTGTGNADMGLSLQQAAENTPTRRAILQNMETELTKASIGPGTGTMNTVKAALGMDKEGVAAREGFNKNALLLAQQQATAMGAGTDAKLEAAMHANPNGDLSKLGATQIIQVLKGNEDAIATKNAEWQKAQQPAAQGGKGYGPQDYGRFSSEFNKSFDPRVFQSSYMTDKEFLEMDDKLKTPKERQAFSQAYATAVQNGWIPPRGGTNAGR
jgi:hypothetical protein